MLSDSSGKYQGIESAEPGAVRTDPFLRLVTEELEGLARFDIGGAAGDEIAHLAGGFRYAGEAAAVADEFVHLVGREVFGAHEVDEQAGVEVAWARAHHEPGGGGEGHGGVDGRAAMERRHAGAGAEVR